jgi:uncharacterized protein
VNSESTNRFPAPDSAVVDFPFLWRHLSERFRLGPGSIHGPDHWRRVEQNGLRLVNATAGADVVVVRLFAVFHDSERVSDHTDPEHGLRAAELMRRLHGNGFTLSEEQLATLFDACARHADGDVTDDLTIGCCWDADRLDLPRVGIEPHRDFMSTAVGKNLARW